MRMSIFMFEAEKCRREGARFPSVRPLKPTSSAKKNTSNDSIKPPLQFEHKATVILETFGPVDL